MIATVYRTMGKGGGSEGLGVNFQATCRNTSSDYMRNSSQVAEIAERSTDGAARAAACELLHAVTLKMLGTLSLGTPPLTIAFCACETTRMSV